MARAWYADMVSTHGDHVLSERGTTEIERVRTFSKLLDRYGLDPILGFLVPGIGDLVGSAFGLYIVGIAVRRRMPKVVIARMLLNLGLDAVFGVVPVLGDLADLAFKANQRNLALLESRPTASKPRASDWLIVGGAVLAFVAAIAGVVWAIVAFIRAIA
ncbi:MAG: DUF4112 domain-containing protein [Kofleriaceae bacterium]